MRSIWKGSISFGLVSIPVAVYPATREQKIKFRLLRKSDLTPVQYQRVAEAEVEEDAPDQVPALRGSVSQTRAAVTPPVSRTPSTIIPLPAAPVEAPAMERVSEIVKGYEYEKGKFVPVTEEDFAKVKIESTHTIEITDFVELAQINPKYFYKPYFLEPQKGGEKGYSLLHHALADTGKLGIAKVSIRSKEYLAGVRADGLFLMLELMHFADEVLEPEGLRSAAAEVAPRELEMAKKLVEAMTTEWEPAKYENSYLMALKQIVEEKIENRPAPEKPAPARKEIVGDILAILQQSLRQTAETPKPPARRKTAGRTSTAALVKQKRRGAGSRS